jgi:hypothetical protein
MIDTAWKKIIFSLLTPLAYIIMKSSSEGAQTTLQGILEREEKLVGGAYYADCKPAPLLAKQC